MGRKSERYRWHDDQQCLVDQDVVLQVWRDQAGLADADLAAPMAEKIYEIGGSSAAAMSTAKPG